MNVEECRRKFDNSPNMLEKATPTITLGQLYIVCPRSCKASMYQQAHGEFLQCTLYDYWDRVEVREYTLIVET